MHAPQVRAGLFTALIVLAGCAGGEKAADTTAVIAPAPASGGTAIPAPGGQVHVVEMITDETGNYFKPKEIQVKRGDVVRYTLATGVHNVNFFPDSNPKWVGAPVVSDMLQLPGQTFDLAVTFAPGRYYFHCDPHAALGMVGHLAVSK